MFLREYSKMQSIHHILGSEKTLFVYCQWFSCSMIHCGRNFDVHYKFNPQCKAFTTFLAFKKFSIKSCLTMSLEITYICHNYKTFRALKLTLCILYFFCRNLIPATFSFDFISSANSILTESVLDNKGSLQTTC